MDSSTQTEIEESRADGPKSGRQAVETRGPTAVLKGTVNIYPGKPIPGYDTDMVKAYEARYVDKDEQPLFALICEPSLIPRVDAASLYGGISNPSLAPLVEEGAVFWPPAGRERYVFVYKDILGKRLLQKNAVPALGWRQEDAMELFIRPLAQLLEEFSFRDFAHGDIRPENMFVGKNPGKMERVILGECLSTPASYAQPVLYETISRAMADPDARGPGSLASDLYSFGVSLAVLLRSSDPMEGLADDEIIRQKIEMGSYTAIAGKERFKNHILELLRGLLQDDEHERWTIQDVMIWVDGKRLSPKQVQKQRKAQRPLTMNRKKYFTLPYLAMDLDTNVAETVKLVETDELDQWLRRSLENLEAADRAAMAVQKTVIADGKGPGYENRVAAHLSAALDPYAPVRYKGLKLAAAGFGTSLARSFILKKDLRPYIEIIGSSFILGWISGQQGRIDVTNTLGNFEKCRKYVSQKKGGYGIERCMYTLCSELPCLSEKFDKHHVQTPEDMMRAMEDLCNNGKAPLSFFDRHSIAFLSVKDARLIDPFIFDLGSTRRHVKALAELKCMARIQKLTGLGTFPGIATAFVEMLEPAFERYHDREIREKIIKSVKKHASTGHLSRMISALSDPELQARDLKKFRIVMHEYALLSREAAELDEKLEHKQNFARPRALKTAAVASCLIAVVVVFLVFVMSASNKVIF